MNFFLDRRTALLIAKALTLAISLSTTLVNSSKTIVFWSRQVLLRCQHASSLLGWDNYSFWANQGEMQSQQCKGFLLSLQVQALLKNHQARICGVLKTSNVSFREKLFEENRFHPIVFSLLQRGVQLFLWVVGEKQPSRSCRLLFNLSMYASGGRYGFFYGIFLIGL